MRQSVRRRKLGMGWDGGQMSFLGEVKRAGPGWSALDRWQRSIGQISNKQRTRRGKTEEIDSPLGSGPCQKKVVLIDIHFPYNVICVLKQISLCLFSQKKAQTLIFPS